MSDIDKLISQLFKERWSGDLYTASIDKQRLQLRKTLQHQMQGYWSGHTAYSLAVEGGFLLDAKSGTNKKLTALGKVFMDSFDN